MGTLYARVAGAWVPVLSGYANSKSGTGLIRQILKPDYQTGITTEVALNGFTGITLNPIANRWTSVRFGFILGTISQPASQGSVYVRLRAGSDASGTVLAAKVFPWVAGQLAAGAIVDSLSHEFKALALPANQVATLTAQGLSMTISVDINSWLEVTDLGGV